MSERRKKDRYNETWTKDELTDSLRHIDRKSSHRSSEKSKRRDDDERRERRHHADDDRQKSRHRSRAGHDDSKSSRDIEERDRREHRSKKYDDDIKSERKTSDRHGSRSHDNRERHRDRRDHELNGDDRHHKRRNPDGEHVEKRSSRHKNDEDQQYQSKHSRHEVEKRSEKTKDRRYHEDNASSREEKRHHDRSSKYDDQNSKYDKRERGHELDRRESRRHSKYGDEHNDDRRHHRSSKHRNDEDDEGKYRQRKEEKRRQRDDRHAEEKDRRRESHHRRDEKRYDEDERKRKEDRIRSKDHHRDNDEHRRERHDREMDSRDKRKEGKIHHRDGDDDDGRKRKESRRRNDDENRKERHRRREEMKDDDHRKSRDEKSHSSKNHQDSHSGNNTNDRIDNPGNEEEEEEDYNYEDEEFEDYDDDFEDDDSTDLNIPQGKNFESTGDDEMDDMLKALRAENERANSARSSAKQKSGTISDNDGMYSQESTHSREQLWIDSGKSASSQLTTINFSTKSKSMKARKKMLMRSKDLSTMIQLDTVGFDLLDMPPVTEYNLYIKNYGNSNTAQVSVQCNDDNLNQDTQTDVPDSEVKWTQHPPHDLKCSGGDEKVSRIFASDRDSVITSSRIDTLHLTKFMKSSTKLMEMILNEDEMWEKSKKNTKRKSSLSFCETVTRLQTNLSYLHSRRITHITSSQKSTHNLIAVAFEPASHSVSTRIDRKGLIAIWDSRKPAIPEKILVCDACPTYCSFGGSKSYILFAGTDDGCVLAFDLRESGAYHQTMSLDPKRETILRNATYTTGFLEDGHMSPIVAIMSVSGESSTSEEKQIIPHNIDRKSHAGLAFQLASLEEAARIFIWIVVEMLPETESEDDLGLAPHGKIKLMRSLNFAIPPPVKSSFQGSQFLTTCVQFSAIDPNNFYVGTDTGHIVHCTQFSNSNEQNDSSNNTKNLLFNELDSVSSVTSIDINPFQLFGSSLILAGHNDGCLRLYLSDRMHPVISWAFSTDGNGIAKVQWSSSRPSVFFVLDENHGLHVWDLAIMHSGPIKSEVSNDKLMKIFSLSNALPTYCPEMVLAYEEPRKDRSIVEVHKLSPHFTQVTDDQELEQLIFLIQSLL